MERSEDADLGYEWVRFFAFFGAKRWKTLSGLVRI